MLGSQGSRSPGVQQVQTRGSRAVSGTGVLYGVPMAAADWLRGSLKGRGFLYCKRRPTLTGSDSAHLGAGPEQTTYQNSLRSISRLEDKTRSRAVFSTRERFLLLGGVGSNDGFFNMRATSDGGKT